MSELARVIEPADSEVELVDVLLVERRQRAEHDLAVRADLVLAQPAGGERLARLAGDPPGDEARAAPGGAAAPRAPRAGAAGGERSPTSLGTQSWNSSTVPFSTNLRI